MVCSDEDAVLVYCGEERAEGHREAIDLLVIYIPTLTYGHEVWAVTKDEITDTSSRKELPLESVS